ncbi:hypothetical protein [Streptomyces alfalfae]
MPWKAFVLRDGSVLRGVSEPPEVSVLREMVAECDAPAARGAFALRGGSVPRGAFAAWEASVPWKAFVLRDGSVLGEGSAR